MIFINGVNSNEKIDSQSTLGLLGTENSLSYRVHEIERHLHSSGSWFEAAGTPTATHFADRIGTVGGAGAFRIDAGDSSVSATWGDWVQLLGSGDTPARTAQTYFDPHEAIIAAAERTAIHFIQFGRGASGAAALAAGTYTEFAVDTTDKAGGSILRIQTGRSPAGSLLWARCLCPGQNTAWLDLYFGIHEYQG